MINYLTAFVIFSSLALYGSKGVEEVKTSPNEAVSELSGVLVDADKEGRPMPHVEVRLYQQYQPFFLPKSWREIDRTKTGNEGAFRFFVAVRGPYQVRWYPNRIKGFRIEDVPEFQGKKVLRIEHTDKIETPW